MSRRSTRRAAARRRSDRASRSRTYFGRTTDGPTLYRRPLRLEPLEERRLLSITVTTLEDTIDFNDGRTSLREAIFAANTVPGADTIEFAPQLTASGPATILLTQGELKITDSLTITGPGAELLTIDASGNDPTPDSTPFDGTSEDDYDGTRVILVNDGEADTDITVSLFGLTLTGGEAQSDDTGAGGGILSFENLTLNHMRLVGNIASKGGGAAAIGGSFQAIDSEFIDNIAWFEGNGGGVTAINTDLLIQSSIIRDNVASFSGGGVAIFNSEVRSAVIKDAIVDDNLVRLFGGEGGGIAAEVSGTGGRFELIDSEISNNVVGGFASLNRVQAGGGGVHLIASNGATASIVGTTVASNRVEQNSRGDGGSGGGLWAEAYRGNLTISQSQFIENVTTEYGGGISVTGVFGGAILIEKSVISGNTALIGGGLLLGRNVTVNECEVSGNTAQRGGGAFVTQGSTNYLAQISRSTFDGNHAILGGGVYSARREGIQISDSTISKNQADSGGGMWAEGMLRVTGSTISGNAASVGGGVFMIGAQGASIDYSTIAFNQATGVGNGLHLQSGFATFDHVILTSNSGLVVGDATVVVGASLQARNSIIGRGQGSGLDPTQGNLPDANGNLIGSGGDGINVRLAPLADNGGPTLTHALLPGSPAINAGDPAAIAGQGGVPLNDQRGVPFTRVYGGRIDIGAVESIPNDFLPGDYHVDHVVDARDYTVWQDTLGAVVTPGAGADGNGDGVVDERDYAVWKSNFGAQGVGLESAGSRERVAAVEEPVTIAGDNPQVHPLSSAGPILVTTLTDTIDFNDGKTSLREAIFAANTVPGADTIEFAAALTASGPATILLTQGELKITDSLTINGPGADFLTIDASGNDPTPDVNRGDGIRVFKAYSPRMNQLGIPLQFVVSGLTMTGGDTGHEGGAVYCEGILRMSDCVVRDNASIDGGGVAWMAKVWDQIGVHNAGLFNCTFVGNYCGFFGGGGGLSIRGFIEAGPPECVVSNCVFTANTSFGSGGGLLFLASGTLKVLESEFTDNRAGDTGGAIVAEKISITSSLVHGNSAGRAGGGLYLTGVAEISNSTISENSAEVRTTYNLSGGGGVTAVGELAVRHSTIVGNVGGGMIAFNASLEHTIVAKNTSDSFAGPFDVSANVEMRFSLLGSNRYARITDLGGNLIGTAEDPISPLLAPLADNGGLTLTHALLPGSPAINAGDLNAVAGEDGVPQFDQRGEPFGRIVGARIDIGAFEYELPTDLNLVVDTLVDESDGDYSPGDLSFREAIELANAARFEGVVDTIHFDPALTANGPAAIVLTQGELKITDSLTINGPGAGLLTIDASGNDPTPDENNNDGSRIFNIDNGIATEINVMIVGLTLTGGDTSGNGGAILSREQLSLIDSAITENVAGSGGGIYAVGSIFVENAEISHNFSENLGGGLTLFVGASRVASISRSSITNNQGGIAGAYQSGGGIFISSTGGSTSITDSVIADNRSLSHGGGIYANVFGPLEIRRCTIARNEGGSGSGIFLSAVGTIASIHNVQIIDNRGVIGRPQGSGAFFRATNSARILFDRCLIKGNSGAYNGGGLFLDSSVGSEIIVSQSVIAKNRAEYGGGVVVSVQDSIYTAPGSVEIAHCTVSGNTGHVGDGGIYMFGDGNFRMTYSTVVENSAEQSILETLGYKPTGGIAINHSGSDPVVIDHVIVARNFAPSTAPSDFEINSAIEVRHSLVGNNSGTQLAEAPVGMPDAHGNLIGGPVHGMIDPLLGPLADNGGFELPDGSRILTHALLAGSPAINAGDLNAVAGEDGVPQFDQRGEPFGRIVGARIDIGAFEYELPTDLNLVVDTLVDESDGDYSRGDLSLREAIELANATRFKGVVDTITFDPALIADGPATILLTQGELKITDSLTISGPGADQLTIDAGGNDPTPDADNADGSRVLNIDDEDPLSQLDVVLRGLTISGGDVDGFGGGVFSAESLEVRRVAVVDNQASSGGGGLAIFLTEEATASFTESTISNNLALGPGGGIYLIHQGSGAVSIAKTKVIGNSVYGTIANGGGLSILLNDETTASLTESTISNNFVRGPGGGMYLIHEGTGAVSIAKTKVIENSTYDTVAFGGGMCVSLGGGNVSLLDNEFGMNSTQGTGGEGGGLLLQARGEGDVRVEGNSFHENSPSGTGGEGGGAKIVHSGSGDVLIEANTFAANTSAGTSGGGGGAYVAHSGSGNLMVDGNTFSANSTRGNGAEGGGLRVGRSGSGQLAVTNNRVLANSTQGTDGSGGGVYVVATGTGSVLVTNNLFDGNKSRGTSAEGGGGYFRHVGSGDLLVTGNTFMRNSILGTSANGGGLAVVRSGTGQAKVYGNTAGGNMAGGTVSTGIGIFVSAISSGVVQLYGNAATDNLLLTPDRGSFGGIGISTSAGGRINAYGNVASRNFGGLSAQGSGTSYVYSNDLTDNVGTGMILSATFAGSVINSYHNVVTGNRSNSSAGGILVSAQLNGKVSVSDTLVAENEAASSGGGIYMFMRLGGAIEIDRTLVSGNQLVGNDIGIDSRGAGVYLRAEDGTFLMKDSTVSGNTALSGAGGIYVTTAITDSVEIRNCTISGNTVGGNGGGLYLKGYVRANQVTVTQNSASAGGGVFVATGGIVANGLITAGNFALIGSDLSGFLGSSLDLHYSLVGNNSASGLAEAPVGSPDAKGNLIGGSTFAKRIDPLLSPLDDNGGFELPNGLRILTHAPLPGSPAINAGDLAAVAGQGFVTLHDQRGAPFTRVFGGRIDIGAVESIPAGFLPGDYRVDGRVDAMDYSVWRDTLGAIVSPGAGADGNGDGLVDERDFTVWKSNFGAMAGQGARHGESLTGGSPRRIFDTEQGEKSRNTNAAADRPLVALDAAALAHQSTQPEWVRARAVLPARSETGARHDQALEAWLSRRRFAIQNEVTLPSTAREANTEGITAVDIAFDQLEAFAKQRRQSWGLSEVRQR